MNVQELIVALQKCDPDAYVLMGALDLADTDVPIDGHAVWFAQSVETYAQENGNPIHPGLEGSDGWVILVPTD